MPADLPLRALPLTARAFYPFGDVIEIEGRESHWINDHTCRRFDDLAVVDVVAQGGRPLISVFEAAPRELPFSIRTLERHPLSSQAFYPLDPRPYLVVVAEEVARSVPAPTAAGAGATTVPGSLHVFLASCRQGVNYRPNIWHHALLALEDTSRFLVVDRGGPGRNCEEVVLDCAVTVHR